MAACWLVLCPDFSAQDPSTQDGEVSEWLKELAWKAGMHHKCIVGSNPTPSANKNPIAECCLYGGLGYFLDQSMARILFQTCVSDLYFKPVF